MALTTHYEAQDWVGEDGHLYVRVEALEWDRPTTEAFFLRIKREVRAALARLGLSPSWANGHGMIQTVETERDYASLTPIAYVVCTTERLPDAVLESA